MDGDTDQVVPPRIQPEHAHIRHVREQAQGSPEIGVRGIPSDPRRHYPAQVLPTQAPQHVAVLRHENGIVEIDELKSEGLAEDGRHHQDKGEGDAGNQPR